MPSNREFHLEQKGNELAAHMLELAQSMFAITHNADLMRASIKIFQDWTSVALPDEEG